MKLNFFNRIKNVFEKRSDEPDNFFDSIFSGRKTDNINEEDVMNIASVSASINLISSIIASIPIKLCCDSGGKASEIEDERVELLNSETGNLLDSFQTKKAFIRDYLINGNGYIYINRKMNKVVSLHYVKSSDICVVEGTDRIFRTAKFLINGKEYHDFDFIRMLRNTKDGINGSGILKENEKVLRILKHQLEYELMNAKSGGNKKGFLKSQKHLTRETIEILKESWKNLYSNSDEYVTILNDGIDFQTAANTAVEQQFSQTKETNLNRLAQIILVPPDILNGKSTDMQYKSWINNCIMPILKEFTTALDKALLLEKEKKEYYFVCDTRELIKSDFKATIEAYKTAIEANILQIDEVRYELDKAPLGFNYIKLGLQDVLLNPVTKEIYTANTNAVANLDNLKGSDNIESGNKKQSGNN